MPRQPKVGLDYFSLDVHTDNKLKLIEAEFGLTGFAVIVKLWQKIYAERGYYCEFDEEVALLFANENKVGGSAVSEIVRAAVKRGIFDRELYEKYKILTSHGVQKRYLEATDRRVRVEIESRYLLLSSREIKENVDINGISVDINAENACRSTQSKVNKTKVNKIKGEETTTHERTKHPHGTFNNVFLTDEEYEKLKMHYPNDWQSRIDHLSEYMEYSDKEYKNHFVTIRYWAKEDAKKEQQPKKSKFNNYDDTNRTDYADLENKLFDMMLEDGGETE